MSNREESARQLQHLQQMLAESKSTRERLQQGITRREQNIRTADQLTGQLVNMYPELVNIIPELTQVVDREQELVEQEIENESTIAHGNPEQLPEFLIINGLKLNFISFEQIGQMLQNNHIERYVIDPPLQSWTSPPNSILTMFGKNGITYLVKARYDQPTNQIFPPV